MVFIDIYIVNIYWHVNSILDLSHAYAPPATPRQIIFSRQGIKMPHPYIHRDGNPLCFCAKCVHSYRIWNSKEPNTDFPDCEDCYLQFNHVIGQSLNVYCPIHPDPTPPPQKPKHKLAAIEGTEYAFTLTMPPDYVSKLPIDVAARKILEMGQTSKPQYEYATEWAYVIEHTDKGTPHIHGVYKTPSGKRIEQKYFKRHWDLWDEKINLGHGHKGGYHQKARHSESYANYMSKEGVVIKSIPIV